MKKPEVARKATLSIRLSPDLKRRMLEACDASPYRISVTTLVERGVELALKEIAGMRGKKSK